MIVFGEIESISKNIAKVKVEEHDDEVYECFMIMPLFGKNITDLPFSKGDRVACFLSDGRNIILGAEYDNDSRDSEAGDDTLFFSSEKSIIKTSGEQKMKASKFDISNDSVTLKDLFADLKGILNGFKVVCGQSGSPSTGLDPGTTTLIAAFETKYSQLLK